MSLRWDHLRLMGFRVMVISVFYTLWQQVCILLYFMWNACLIFNMMIRVWDWQAVGHIWMFWRQNVLLYLSASSSKCFLTWNHFVVQKRCWAQLFNKKVSSDGGSLSCCLSFKAPSTLSELLFFLFWKCLYFDARSHTNKNTKTIDFHWSKAKICRTKRISRTRLNTASSKWGCFKQLIWRDTPARNMKLVGLV